MKLLLIHQMFLEEDDPGGSRFNEMTRQWQEEGHEITVYGGMVHYNGTSKKAEYKGKYFVKKMQGNVEVWRCHVSESYNKNFLGRLWGYFSFLFSSVWVGLFKDKNKYDVILVTSPPLFVGITAYVLSRVKKIPYIFEVRDLWPESAIDTGVLTNKFIIKLAYWVERFLYKHARLINVLTPAFRTHLIEEKGIDPSKIIFVPNAADFSLSEKLLKDFDAEEFRRSLGWQDKFVITYVGAHGVANGLQQVLDAAEQMRGSNVLFVLIGNGMVKEDLVAEAGKKDLSNIRFLPSVPKAEVFKYILSSDMGASILKKVDTFKTVYSNKTFDYMACKKPVLMAIDGVSRQLVEEANCGMYVEPENPDEYKRVINTYIADPLLLKQHGENGYVFAKNKFDRKVLATQYISHVESVLN